MKKSIIFSGLLASLLLVGCAGKETNNSTSTNTSTNTSTETTPTPDPTPDTTPDVPEVVAPTSVEITAEKTAYPAGERFELTAKVLPETAPKDIVWTTSDKNIVEIRHWESEGDNPTTEKFGAKAEGEATITATAKDTQIKAEIKITVSQPLPASITTTGSSELYIGETMYIATDVEPYTAEQGATLEIIEGADKVTATKDPKGHLVVVGKAAGTFKVKSVATTKGTGDKVIENVRTYTVAEKGANLVSFDFGANKPYLTKHNDGSAISKGKEYTVGSDKLKIADCSCVYDGANDLHGNSALKLGTSKGTATLSFVVPEDVKSVEILIAGYKYNTVKFVINDEEEQTVSSQSDSGDYTKIVVDTTTNKTVKLATSAKPFNRAMINRINFVK